MQQHRLYWHMKVPRYSFSGSIPAHLEKIATTVVLDKDENCRDQGCNDIGVVIAAK